MLICEIQLLKPSAVNPRQSQMNLYRPTVTNWFPGPKILSTLGHVCVP